MRKLLRQLLNAPNPGDKVSSSYLWYHIGNIAATVVFVKAGLSISEKDAGNVEGLSLLMLTYLGLITGNKLAIKFMRYRAQGVANFKSVQTSTTTVVKEDQTKGVQNE